MKRNILLHCHFFKNAGSSIDWSLARNFGENFFENKQHFYSVHDWNAHLECLSKETKIQCVTSHIFSLHPPEIEGVAFFMLAMLRHPIERVTSVAAYEKKQGFRNTHGNISDHSQGIKEYINAYMQDGSPATIRNIHVLRFAGRDNGLPVTDQDYQKAVATLRRIDTVGLVEYFDESMVLFEELLRPIFPQLDLAYIPQNVRQDPKGRHERLDQLHAELGDELFSLLCEKNRMDLELYHLAQEVFRDRIRNIPRFDYKLEDFRKRCSLLA